MTILPRMLEGLRRHKAEEIILIAGGVIPDEDVPKLLEMGVAQVLSQDTPLDVIPDQMRETGCAAQCEWGELGYRFSADQE